MKLFNLLIVALVLTSLSCAKRWTTVAYTDTREAALVDDVVALSDSASIDPSNPATQPATPPSAAALPALPKGHPDITSMTGQSPTTAPAGLPAGHPAIPQATNPIPGLPKGHPDISSLNAAPTSQPALGSLSIHVKQGTAGGPAIGADPIVAEAYRSGAPAGHIESKLDEHGNLTIQGVPNGPGLQTVVRVTHGGVDFETPVPARADGEKDQKLEITVAESTEQTPQWFVPMRHVMVSPIEGGLHVVEMIAVQNPSDCAWVGVKNDSGKRTTFTLALPQAAKDIELVGGFTEKAQLDASKIVNGAALMPGVSNYQLAYTLPLDKGKAQITAGAPAPVKNMLVFFPADGSGIIPQGLTGPETVDMGNGASRLFRGADLAAGSEVKLTVDQTSATPPKQSSAAGVRPFDAAELSKAIGGVGALMIVLLGGALLLIKSPTRGRKSR